MRLDHIAYRVKSRKKTANFFIKSFGYRVQDEFEIEFEDGSKAKCLALEPPEKHEDHKRFNWNNVWTFVPQPAVMPTNDGFLDKTPEIEYHLPPEIFVSDGTPNSIVGKWVAKRDGIGGIHHLAYQVDSVEKTMKEWKEKGYAEFTTDDVLKCEGLKQVFTRPSELTGVIYEFIERGVHGFCQGNVKQLMESTNGKKDK